MRRQRSLSGSWQFQFDPDGTITPDTLAPDKEIRVPLPWQVAFPESQQYSGYAWYRCYVDLDADWLAGELLLHFGAVDYWCQVFVNGELAGEHEGGYTPFAFHIKSHARVGRNSLEIRVYDSAQAHLLISRWPEYPEGATSSRPPFDANNIPHGKQEWYINVGGIWQDVTLTAVPATYIERIHATPNIHTGEVHLAITLAGAPLEVNSTLRVQITDASGARTESTLAVKPGERVIQGALTIDNPRLWQLEDPHLYTAGVTLHTSQGDDTLAARLGFREITTRDGRIMLNGEPIFLLSVLDQDLYPETIYTMPSEEYLRDQFQKAKELGFNNLRCHIKPPDPRYLELADEMGLLVWAEIPSWRTFWSKGTTHRNQLNLDDTIKARVRRTLEEMVSRDFNHPSLIIWTIVNEDWGTALPLSAADRAWVGEMYDFCKSLDPTRLVVDNSACPHPWGPNVHVKSDLDDFHVYANIPDAARSFAQMIEQFDLRPVWTYSTHGDAERSGKEPLLLSEFGNWGLPSLKLLRDAEGRDPSWFETGPWWSTWEGEAGWPSGVDRRFQEYGLDTIWRDYEEFATATQWHQFAAMKFEIETLRRQPAISGYVVTELTDAYWESNGLLDFNRNPKVYHDLFPTINAPDVISVQTEQYAYWDDQHLHVRPHIARYSRADWHGARLSWSIEDADLKGECDVEPIERAEVQTMHLQSWALPEVKETGTVQVRMALRNRDGATLARNALDVLVLPAGAREPAYKGQVAVITRHNRLRSTALDAPPIPELGATPVNELDPDQPPVPRGAVAEGRAGLDLESTIHSLGYNTTRHITANTGLTVSNYPNAELLRWVREGGDLLCMSRGASPFFWVQNRGGVYGGGWITSYSWLRPGIYKRLKVDNPLGMPFMHVMPTRTILGLPFEDKAVQGDFLAGMISGWVRHPAVHTVQFRYGRGRVIMTTFVLEENLYVDPVAVAMFHDLVEHLSSDACQPTLSANW